MEVTIEVSGLIEKSLGYKTRLIQIPENTTVSELIGMLEISINKSWLVITVNNQSVSIQRTLSEDDCIKILPICGGG